MVTNVTAKSHSMEFISTFFFFHFHFFLRLSFSIYINGMFKAWSTKKEQISVESKRQNEILEIYKAEKKLSRQHGRNQIVQ